MIYIKPFHYQASEHEAETASNSYLMSLIALVGGLPFPIINLFATVFFYLANRKGTGFVRWHCTQALFSQLSLLLINTIAFWWTISIIFASEMISNFYLAYIINALLYNIAEFIATIYTAIQTRKGLHVNWFFYGNLCDIITKDSNIEEIDSPF